MATKTARKQSIATDIPYEPETWNEQQLAFHRAATMEEAFHHASCLAGGWYRRAITIDFRITESNDEEYMLRPSEIAPLDGWAPCYTVAKA